MEVHWEEVGPKEVEVDPPFLRWAVLTKLLDPDERVNDRTPARPECELEEIGYSNDLL
jgi:hypothetical protein